MTEHATIDHGERAHAILSASGADRWLNCPGSVRLTKDMPDRTSEHAQWGTTCHELAETALKSWLKGVKAEYPEGKYDAEMFAAVLDYRAFIDALITEYGEIPAIFIEERVDFSQWVPGGFGTADCVLIFMAAKTAVMVDLKGGKGVKVFAEDNPQLKFYGAGTLALLAPEICELETIELCIAQPRLDHFDRWKMPVAELRAWLGEIKPIAEEAYAGSDKFAAGDHCMFCKAKAQCPERKREAVATFEQHDKIPGLLTLDEIGALLPKLKRIEDWAKSVAAFALEQTTQYGAQIPGYKLVEGRSVRVWSDPAAVEKTLKDAGLKEDDIWKRTIIGITDAEKKVGKKHPVFELTKKPKGKPTLAPVSDPRPVWCGDFDDNLFED